MEYIFLLIICLLALYSLCRRQENFTEHMVDLTPEAVQNIASVYNKDNMAVTNIKTNTLQLGDKWKISGVGDKETDDSWLRLFGKDGPNYYGGFAAGQLYTANDLIVRKNASINGNLSVDGTISKNNQPLEIKTAAGNMFVGPANGDYCHVQTDRPRFYFNKEIILHGPLKPYLHNPMYVHDTAYIITSEWNQNTFVKHIEDGRYFNRGMPNGTILKFLFVTPGGSGNLRYCHAIKYNNQFLVFNMPPDHTGITFTDTNDRTWRGIVY
jgi:hypothetical protein